MDKSKFAVGAILVHIQQGIQVNAKEEVAVNLIEAYSREEALGRFFFAYLGKPIMIKDFSIKGDTTGVSPIDAEIVNFLKNGRKIEAIRRCLVITGKGLREAKDYVEQVAIPQLEKEGVLKLND